MAFASVDTWDVDPEGPIGVKYSRRGVKTRHADGQVLARQVRTAASKNTEKAETRIWSLRWEHGTPRQRSDILEILDNCMMGILPVDWTPPGEGSAIQVRVLGSTFVEEFSAPQSYRMAVELEELV